MKLQGKIAVVTGGASGMGKACVQALTSRGVRTVVWDKQINAVETNDMIFALRCDVSSSEEVEHALKVTTLEMGVPRICINCAGIAPAKRIVGREGPMSLDWFKQVINVNLVGTFNVMRVIAAAMVSLPLEQEEERGVILNTASIAAFEGQIGQAAYSAAKSGVVGLTLPAARELAQHAIRVNTIAPGLIATPMLLNMSQEVQESLIATAVFPKRLGHPEEFAALAIHLIENSLINGETIRLDGAVRLPPR